MNVAAVSPAPSESARSGVPRSLVVADVGGTVLLGTNIPTTSASSSHQQINCIMQQTQQPYKLLSMPWRRAKQEVKMGRIDGYFTAIPNEEMNDYAKLSAPLFLENWYWFWHPRHRQCQHWIPLICPLRLPPCFSGQHFPRMHQQ